MTFRHFEPKGRDSKMHFHCQRQMVGKVGPRLVPEYLRLMAAGIAQVDAIQAQQGEPRGVGFGRAAMVALEGFVQVVAAGKGGIALHLPVVEVAGNDHRRIIRQGLEELAEQLQLQLTMAFQQAEVHADGMHFAVPGTSSTQCSKPRRSGPVMETSRFRYSRIGYFDSRALPW